MKPFATLLTLCVLTSQAADPSGVPLRDPADANKFAARYRVIADLDEDGTDDLLLSVAASDFGKSGGAWTVYLNRKGSYVAAGEVFAHPKAISIEPDHARISKDIEKRCYVRIWVYLRGGAGAGVFGYYRVREKSVEKLQSVEIYPGDGGTSLGNAVYAATFGSSPVKFRLDKSTTDAAGTVHWKQETE